MRRKELIKSILLGVLIITSIIQTTMLWLGNIPSQTFFNQMTVEEVGISPSNIWIIKPGASNSGKASSFAYKMNRTIESTKREYERLNGRLQMILRAPGIDYKKVEELKGIQWDKLLTIPTIVYDYEIPLTIGEISGGKQENSHIKNVDMVFVHSDTKFEKSLILSLISTSEQKTYRIQVAGDFKEFSKIYNFFTTEEMTSGVTKYQPSALANVSEYIRGNAFMPIGGLTNPIEYEVLMTYNPISMVTEYGMKELEKYVNGFFINPMLKDVEYSSDGTIIFTEPAKNVVMYNPKGVIEYMNLSPKSNNTPATVISGYNVARDFLEDTDALTDETKKGLYLSKIEKNNQEIAYSFDMAYNGYKIALSKKIKEQMKIDALVKIIVKNDQVISATVCTLQFAPHTINGDTRTALLKTEYVDPINEALEVILKQGEGPVVFDEVETVYLVNEVEGVSYLTRGVLLDGRWYYP